MIQNLLVDNRKQTSLKYEMEKVLRVTFFAFLISSSIHLYVENESFEIVYLLKILSINLIMSFSITLIPSLAGAFLIKFFSKKISLGLRSIIAFFLLVIAILIGIYLGQTILILLRLINAYVIGITFWLIFLFSCFVGAIVVIYYGAKEKLEDAYEKIRTQERQKSELELLKSQAEFEALQAKINPHFLFNSLNSIAGLISVEANKAEEMTLKLAELFRSSLKYKDDSFATIKDEIKLVKNYLDIEQIRFGKRLSYSFTIDDKLNTMKIPQLLIQPIVENALKHGIEKLTNGGRIEVSVQKKNDFCEIIVSDSGEGIDGNISFGYGLTNIQKRLTNIYKDDFTFEILSENGTKVCIEIPLSR